ncbi:IBR finger domain-containing protein [Colletotrichum salicis]|uniref:RBR-type E3 ubiquitin transferase n=1 Tax=Colletotrichum salicis TaxID=1209931 RepID=A0A135RNE2_9PEZI|nr:IBR finger domain-containing protein [Colletotrichum salicis]
MLLYEIDDDETLRLVLQMHLEDLESIKQSSKGKCRAGEVTDLDLAIETYKSELKSHALLAADRCMCKSIARANQTDGRLITNLARQEDQAARDRHAAIRLSNGEELDDDDDDDDDDVPAAPVRSNKAERMEDEMRCLRTLEALFISPNGGDEEVDDDDDTSSSPESSSWAASRSQINVPATKPVKRTTCDSCTNTYPSTTVAQLPCNHRYCHDCLQTLFELSLTDESLFPPRCCRQPIPVDENRAFLPAKLIGNFRAKELELSTPDRTYCHRPTCSCFIPKEFTQGDIGTCPACRHQTCLMCKGAGHGKQDCTQDTLTQELLQVAAANGWQRCFGCRRIVELDHGCNHMSEPFFFHPYPRIMNMNVEHELINIASKACPCGAQFCYLCGERWKTCTCAQWNEERLVARANAIVDRRADAQRLDAAARAQRVEREAHNLVENHQCAHPTWRNRHGGFRCEECHDFLREYIYECAQCRIHACRRCRQNRL